MTRNKLSKVRRLAVTVVVANLALIGLLAVVLPEAALAALPVLALVLPLLSAAAVEGALTKQSHDRQQPKRARTVRVDLGHPLQHAA